MNEKKSMDFKTNSRFIIEIRNWFTTNCKKQCDKLFCNLVLEHIMNEDNVKSFVLTIYILDQLSDLNNLK